MPMNNTIRPIAVIILRHDDKILVQESVESPDYPRFYRLIGGGIEFGERAHDTIIREVREELNATLRDVRYLGTLENIFVYEGRGGHEIVMLYEGTLVEPHFYEQESFALDENGNIGRAVWLPISHFVAGIDPLYPDDVLEIILQTPHA
jgi:8-oxo-dGTP pyrophosphatase MutT (NUDIX family)